MISIPPKAEFRHETRHECSVFMAMPWTPQKAGHPNARRWERQRPPSSFAIARTKIKFNRTCAAKYPQKPGNRSKPPSLPASACVRSPATWAYRKTPSLPEHARKVDPSNLDRQATGEGPALKCTRPHAISRTHDAGTRRTARRANGGHHRQGSSAPGINAAGRNSRQRAQPGASIMSRGAITDWKTCQPTPVH